MEASELCDQLKAKIAQLEDELKATKESRNDLKGKLEDHQLVVRNVAQHMGVDPSGLVYEVEHRIWVAVNDLRREKKEAQAREQSTENVRRLLSVSDELEAAQRRARTAAEGEALLRSKITDCANAVLGLHDAYTPAEAALPSIVNMMKELKRRDTVQLDAVATMRKDRDQYGCEVNQMRATLHFIADELGLGSRNALPECQWFLKQLQELRVKVDDAKKLGFELKDYHAKYQALDKAADEACNFAGLDRSPGPTVQDTVLDTLERLAKHCVADTTESRIKALERVCYGAESRSGVSCREINPWRRIEYVLNTMAAELASLRIPSKVPQAVRTKVWAIQQNLQAEVNDYTHRDEVEETIKILEAIEAKAYEAQNVRVACIKLKELL